MTTRAPLGEVAPAKAIKLSIHSKDPVWQVTLDHIEPHTGRLVEYETKPFSEVGSSTHGFDQRHVLYSKLRPYLNKVLVPEEQGVGTTELVPMVPDPARLDRRYLAHYLMSHNFVTWISERVSGAKMPRAVMSDLWAHEIPLPALTEQKRIAAILDKADELRAKRREAIAELDNLVQATFLDMFGDPVTNPKGWENATLNDVTERLDGGKNVAQSETPTANRVLKVSAVTSGVYRPSESKYWPEDLAVPDSYKVRRGDLLISRANTVELVGATAFVWNTPDNIVLPDKIWRFVWRKGAAIEPLYLHHFMKTPDFRRILSERASGTSGSMKNISKPKLLGLPILLPSFQIQGRFSEFAAKIREEKLRHERHLVDLNALFNSLQHRAFSGEL